MTVKELIEVLKTFPQDLIVRDECGDEVVNPILTNNDFDGEFVMLKCLWNEPEEFVFWEP